MPQINVDISILMCLPTDSTCICTADRGIAIITAHHGSGEYDMLCSRVFSDIIRPYVHYSLPRVYK